MNGERKGHQGPPQGENSSQSNGRSRKGMFVNWFGVRSSPAGEHEGNRVPAPKLDPCRNYLLLHLFSILFLSKLY